MNEARNRLSGRRGTCARKWYCRCERIHCAPTAGPRTTTGELVGGTSCVESVVRVHPRRARHQKTPREAWPGQTGRQRSSKFKALRMVEWSGSRHTDESGPARDRPSDSRMTLLCRRRSSPAGRLSLEWAHARAAGRREGAFEPRAPGRRTIEWHWKWRCRASLPRAGTC